MNTMPDYSFTFEIEDFFETARDPGGHYRHWTALIGTLQSGSIAAGGRIEIPTISGIIVLAKRLLKSEKRKAENQKRWSKKLADFSERRSRPQWWKFWR